MTESTAYDPYAPFDEPDHALLAELRERCPVARTPKGWFVSSHAGVKDVLKRIEDFRGGFSSWATFPPDELPLSGMDEETHTRVRKAINAAVGKVPCEALAPTIRAMAEELVEEALATAAAAGSVDVVAAYAAPIASRSLAMALGVDGLDHDRFQRWGDELVDRMYDREPAPFSALHPELAASLQALIDARRAEGGTGDDFMSRLIRSGMSDDMVRTQALQLVVAGNETTRGMLGNCFRRLATIPGLYERVRADRSLVANLIEESLRFDAPIQVNGRFAQRPAELGGVSIAEGEHVVVGLAAACRDEAVFEAPDEFRLDRARPKDHVAFGSGPHVCPGAFLAREEGHLALTAFLDRVAAIAPAEPGEFKGNQIFWSMAPVELPLRLVPA